MEGSIFLSKATSAWDCSYSTISSWHSIYPKANIAWQGSKDVTFGWVRISSISVEVAYLSSPGQYPRRTESNVGISQEGIIDNGIYSIPYSWYSVQRPVL